MNQIIEFFAATRADGGAFSLIRTTQETYVDGKKVEGTPTTSIITAVQVPTNGRDLQVKIDCEITTDIEAVLTATQLIPRAPGAEPDQLIFNGTTWTVFHTENWTAPDGDNFCRALVAKRSLQ